MFVLCFIFIFCLSVGEDSDDNYVFFVISGILLSGEVNFGCCF